MDIQKYNPSENLILNNKYIVDCGIEFTYTDNTEKPYLLNNGIYIDHIPTSKDIGTNNLKPNQLDASISHEQAKLLSSKGGIKSAEVQKKKRSMAERLRYLASLGVTDDELSRLDPSIVEKIPPEIRETLTKEDLISAKIVELAMLGSKDHQILYRDTIGEKPTDKQEVTANIMTEGDRLLIEKISARLQVSEKQ